MKKVFIALTLVMFVGTASTSVFAASNKAKTEITKKDDDKKKKSKKSKKACASKQACSTEKGSCCSGKKAETK